jgi:hypothetical protein
VPSSQTNEVKAIDPFNVPRTVRTNVFFSPNEVKDTTSAFTETWSPLGAVMIALYTDVEKPTFVTVLLKLPLK